GPAIHASAIDDDRCLANTRRYLAVTADGNEGELINRVPTVVKICSASHIDQLVKQALPGVGVTHLSSQPGSIPVKLKYQYFSLNQTGPAWEAIQRARNFAAFVPMEIRNPQLELIILLPQNVAR